MAKLKFDYYLHDDHTSNERASAILEQLEPQGFTMDQEEFGELIGRPFYEVTLHCELDTVTGDVTILSTSA